MKGKGKHKSTHPRASKARGPIGLDLGDCYIKAAQMELIAPGKAAPGRLAAALVLERKNPGEPFDAAEALRLRDVLGRRGFTGRRVVLNVPGRHALTSVLSLPPRKEGVPLDQIARSEMAHEHRLESDAFEMAYWELPKPARSAAGCTVMAVACRHQEAHELLSALSSAGFDVAVMDVAGWAAARICQPLCAEDEGVVAVVDLGWDSTTIVLIRRDVVIYQRSSFGCGIRQLRQTLQREQQYPPQVIDYLLCEIGFELDGRGDEDDWKLLVKTGSQLEAHFNQVAREIMLTLDYVHSQYPDAPVKRVLLTGGGAGIPGAGDFLAATCETHVDVVRPADVVGDAQAIGELAQQPSLIPAMGLAMPARNVIGKEAA